MNGKVMALSALALFASLAHAEDYLSPTEERVRLSLGVMYMSNNTGIKLDSSTGVPGTPVNGESDFGLDKHDLEGKIEAMVRASERHRMWFDYFSLDRTGDATVTQPIVFRDVLLQPGDPLNSTLSFRTLGITYGYSFFHTDKYEVAALFGINQTDISVRARVTTSTRHVDQSEDQAGPFPTLGVDGTYVLSKRFYLEGRAQYFRLRVNDVDGSLGFYEFDAMYRLRPNISFALGYNAVRVHLESAQTTTAGYFNLNTNGPQFFVRVGF
jgi:hypothetical protein